MLTEQQKKDRLLGVGGSDMAIIMGLSNYKTPYQLYMEKKGIIESSQEETEQQYWGNRLESVIRDEFSLKTGLVVTEPDTVVHPFYEFMRANLDGWIESENAVLEIKTVNNFMAHQWGEAGSDIIPMQYLVQVVHYVACTNADKAYIAVLIGGNDFRVYTYLRDESLEEMVIEAARTFWENMKNDIAPVASNIPDLRLMFPRHNPETEILINDDVAMDVDFLVQTNTRIKELEKMADEYKFNIMRYMQMNERLVSDEGKTIATWKKNTRGSKTFLLKKAD